MGIMEKVPVKIFYMEFFFASSGYLKSPQGTYLIRLNLRDNRKEQQEWRQDEKKKSDCRNSACRNYRGIPGRV